MIWGVVVSEANLHDGAIGIEVLEPLSQQLDRMKTIGADTAYKGKFKEWVDDNLKDLEVDICVRPPSEKGFIPIKWRWISERTFGSLNFFRRLSVDHEKSVNSHKAWILLCNCQMILNKT